MNRKKIIIIILGIVLVLSAAILATYLISVQNYQSKVEDMEITDVDLSQKPDGTYIGECDVDYIYAKVSVTVKDGAITDIQLLEHKNGKGEPAEAIINDIIKNQSLSVDAVSGATNSSKVIKKAIENALTTE